VIATVAVTPVGTGTRAEADPTPAPLLVDQPELGLRYAGLTPAGPDGPCGSGYRIDKTDLCTHGPDPAPPGLAINREVQPVTSALAAPTVVCEGDGVTGNRVQVLYVRGAETDSRFGAYLESFRTWAAGVDAIYDASAQETGGSRRVRFVTEPDCTVNVLEVVVPATAISTFRDTIGALRDQGFNRSDRKYMLFADSDVYCGIGSFAGDDRPGENNRSNRGPSYGRSDSGCWTASVAAHELGHNLGAVNDSAPNSSKAGHCLDEHDLMCYNDSGGLPTRVVCSDRTHNRRLDCNHDDYYSTDPAPDSYLSTHWNAADNVFLLRPADGELAQ
jgi:hypothetical protein